MKSRIVQIIDEVLLTVLVAFCYRYSFDGVRDFAEAHVQFSFLNFPIFIGEFLLAGCLILFLIRWCLAPQPLNKWHYLLIGYFGFVLLKAFIGYSHWGPLAFRDAALFYYLAFAVIAYYAYRPDYFNNRFFILICYAALIAFFRTPKFNDYWYFGSIALGLILAYCYPNRWFGAFIAVSVLILVPHYYLFYTCRAVILAVFVSLAFLVIMPIFFLKPDHRRVGLLTGFLFVLAAGLYVFHFSPNVSAKCIFNWSAIAEEMRRVNADIAVKKRYFKPEALTAHLYNPDNNTDHYDEPEADGQKATSQKMPAGIPDKTRSLPQNSQDDALTAETPLKSSTRLAEAPHVLSEDQAIESSQVGTSMFRLVIWGDALGDLKSRKPLFGFDFGKPFRSTGLEIIRTAMGEWERDGWICFHNAFLNIIYRTGVFGAAFITVLLWSFGYMTRIFIRTRSWPGLLLCACILSWLVIFGLAVMMELPYGAIPFWVLCGLTLAFANREKTKIPVG
jgi:hypothetical protein